MGLFDFFKSRQVPEAPKGVAADVFNSPQFRMEIQAFALWKLSEFQGNHARVKAALMDPANRLNLSESQASEIMESLRRHNAPGNETGKKLAEGQVWKYLARPNEEGSRLTIHKIETLNGEEIFHISLDGLNVKNGNDVDNLRALSHAPISREALLGSISELERQDAIPEIGEGYAA